MKILSKQSSLTLLTLCSLISISISSQELNEEFLNSLPKAIQEDLMTRGDDEELEDNYKNRPDTRLRKIERSIDSVRGQIDSLEAEISLVEDEETDLNIFGSNFFNSYQSSFAPINQENFSSNYILDVGDSLTIQTMGKIKSKNEVIVSRDGSVNIPNIGIITVAGMPFAEAIKSIKEYAKTKFFDVDLFINLESSRDMGILLIGNAFRPGVYTLPGGSNILTLIHAAGGISEDGSYRSILHKRNNKTIQEIDLYDVLIHGNALFNQPLRSGDAIVINPAKKIVSISGGINVPAIYELKENENLDDLLLIAQGQSLTASNNIVLHKASGEKEIIASEMIESTVLSNGDSIIIPLYKPKNRKIFTVSIEGAVKKPGTYSFTPGTKLSQIIDEAGGYLSQAYPYGGALYRKNVAMMQRKVFDKTYDELINFIASSSGGTSPGISASQNLPAILAELKATEFKGRLSAEFNLSKLKKNSSLDTTLADGDEIFIPFFSTDVIVAGDVLNPGGRQYVSGSDHSEYIEKSGGLARFADTDRIIIIKPNGDADLIRSTLFFGETYSSISPGSTIFVPKEIGKLEGITYTATLAPIVSSLALSLASLNSIN
jgi:protein involved in polysaccharide export with SLBB domain